VTVRYGTSLVVVLAAGLGVCMAWGNANASGINLMCEEVKGLNESERGSSGPLSGEQTKKESTALSELWKIPVLIDTAAGRGTVWGKPYELTVEPDYLFLRLRSDSRKANDSELKSVSMKINRKTLSFNYSNLLILNSWSRTGVSTRSVSARKSEGQCKKVLAAKGNQI